ncbi:hypothetical protein TWF730_001855 [Orbilia blumenaviensis]|uniref:F-box domain-containing protein n=1 Tax=Orbilia blumenaviensis TaxID=1796055 RepID=A0AAV9UD80_9PEZI
MSTQYPVLPIEIQILIIQTAEWTQHPTLSQVCKTWRSIVDENSHRRYQSLARIRSRKYGHGNILIHKSFFGLPDSWQYKGYKFTGELGGGGPLPMSLFGYFGKDNLFLWEETRNPVYTYIWHNRTPDYNRSMSSMTAPGYPIRIKQFWDGVIYTFENARAEFRSFSISKTVFCNWTNIGPKRSSNSDGAVVFGFEFSASKGEGNWIVR